LPLAGDVGSAIANKRMRNFGQAGDHLYIPRHAVFGIAAMGSEIACVAVRHGARSYRDLPGGGVAPGECEEQALIREFEEEAGLIVRPQVRLFEAGQYFRRSNGSDFVLNYGGCWAVVVEGETQRSEVNHRLIWLRPEDAIATVRHDSHAWFILVWLRWKERFDHTQAMSADAMMTSDLSIR
jgi:8-oxo-dGTP diphosphatase